MAEDGRRLVLIGDLHGNLRELRKLWKRVREHLGPEALAAADVVFLGDYCDRGPDTAGVIGWLVDLRDARGPGRTHFIAGNHDFAMAAYLDCLPVGPGGEGGFDLDGSRPQEFTTDFWPFEVEGGMHYQGRRWGGSTVYSADRTFQSYGVRFTRGRGDRAALQRAVPESHKQFLRDLQWVHEQPVAFAPGSVVAVHAGLFPGRPLEPQLQALRERQLGAEVLHEDEGRTDRLGPMVGRYAVLDQHPELEGRALLVSGHHGRRSVDWDSGRLVLDRSGGQPYQARPLEALVLPERALLSHVGGEAEAA